MTATVVIITLIVVSCCLLLLVVFEFLWHWRESDTFWEVWKWIDELSLLLVIVEERASFTELALTSLEEVFAWHGLVVGVHGSESCLSKVVGERLFKNCD